MQRCNGLHLILLLHFNHRFGLHLSGQLILQDSNALGSTLPDGRSCSDGSGSGALHLILPYFSTYVVLYCSTVVRRKYLVISSVVRRKYLVISSYCIAAITSVSLYCS